VGRAGARRRYSNHLSECSLSFTNTKIPAQKKKRKARKRRKRKNRRRNPLQPQWTACKRPRAWRHPQVSPLSSLPSQVGSKPPTSLNYARTPAACESWAIRVARDSCTRLSPNGRPTSADLWAARGVTIFPLYLELPTSRSWVKKDEGRCDLFTLLLSP